MTEYKRAIPAEYLDKEIVVTFDLDLFGYSIPKTVTGVLVFSGPQTIRLRYYRRNVNTKRMRQYFIGVSAKDIIEWHPITNKPMLGE